MVSGIANVRAAFNGAPLSTRVVTDTVASGVHLVGIAPRAAAQISAGIVKAAKARMTRH
jgi:hypothetical protein